MGLGAALGAGTRGGAVLGSAEGDSVSELLISFTWMSGSVSLDEGGTEEEVDGWGSEMLGSGTDFVSVLLDFVTLILVGSVLDESWTTLELVLVSFVIVSVFTRFFPEASSDFLLLGNLEIIASPLEFGLG